MDWPDANLTGNDNFLSFVDCAVRQSLEPYRNGYGHNGLLVCTLLLGCSTLQLSLWPGRSKTCASGWRAWLFHRRAWGGACECLIIALCAREHVSNLLYVHQSQRVTDTEMLMLQLTADRYQDILRKCTSKVISAERQVSITCNMRRTLSLSCPLYAAVCHV